MRDLGRARERHTFVLGFEPHVEPKPGTGVPTRRGR
jgi:hypothetical protein